MRAGACFLVGTAAILGALAPVSSLGLDASLLQGSVVKKRGKRRVGDPTARAAGIAAAVAGVADQPAIAPTKLVLSGNRVVPPAAPAVLSKTNEVELDITSLLQSEGSTIEAEPLAEDMTEGDGDLFVEEFDATSLMQTTMKLGKSAPHQVNNERPLCDEEYDDCEDDAASFMQESLSLHDRRSPKRWDPEDNDGDDVFSLLQEKAIVVTRGLRNFNVDDTGVDGIGSGVAEL